MYQQSPINIRSPWAAVAVGALFCGLLWPASDGPETTVHSLAGISMASPWTVAIDVRWLKPMSRAQLDQLRSWIQNELDAVNDVFSTWSSESEISRLNRGEIDRPCSAEMQEVLHQATALAIGNERFLDFGLQKVLRDYGFELSQPISADRSGAERSRLGPSDDCRTTTEPTDPLNWNLSAVVKGYTVDKLSAALVERGYGDVLVELGGEIAARCSHRTTPWTVAIQHPLRPKTRVPITTLPICNQSLATSGDYLNLTKVNDQIVSHLIDPITRAPKQHRTRSVTVVTDDGLAADAYATAFAVSGLRDSHRVRVDRPLRVLFIDEGDNGRLSTTWKNFP